MSHCNDDGGWRVYCCVITGSLGWRRFLSTPSPPDSPELEAMNF